MGRESIALRMLALCGLLVLVVGACAETTTSTTSASGTTAEGGGDVTQPGRTCRDSERRRLQPRSGGGGDGNDVGMNVILNVDDRLVFISADDGSVIPSLATEVPSLDNGLLSADGLTYTFPLREGVVFRDGTPMTAEDVKYWWDRVVEMALPEGQSELFSNVAETRVVDDLTFEVTLSAIDASFLAFLAAHPVASVVSQEAVEANGGIVAGQPNEYMTQNMVGDRSLHPRHVGAR